MLTDSLHTPARKRPQKHLGVAAIGFCAGPPLPPKFAARLGTCVPGKSGVMLVDLRGRGVGDLGGFGRREVVTSSAQGLMILALARLRPKGF